MMKYLVAFIFLSAIIAGCKPRILSGAELENKLMETIKEHLDKTLEPGTKVTVEDVVYYPERESSTFICQFHVNMKLRHSDTTGIVRATISNDFKKVARTQ